MKTKYFIIFLIFASQLFAQWQPQKGNYDTYNKFTIHSNQSAVANDIYLVNNSQVLHSISVSLDSAASITGTGVDVQGYSSISTFIYSDSSGVLDLQYGDTDSTFNNHNRFAYAGGDTINNVFSARIKAKYFRLVYTTQSDSDVTVDIQSMLHMNDVVNFDGKFEVFKDSTKLQLNSLGGQLSTLLSQTAPANNFRGALDTVSAAQVDTLSRVVIGPAADYMSLTFNDFYQASINSKDTLLVSFDPAFPEYHTIAICPYINEAPYELPKFNSSNNLYIKSASGEQVIYYITVWGK